MKGYQLLDEAKHHFVLQAPNGAKVKIAKTGLSKDTIGKIQGFSKGGKVEYGVSTENTFNSGPTEAFKKAFKGDKQEQPKPEAPPKKLAQYNDGGVVMEPDEPVAPPTIPEMPASQPPVVVNVAPSGAAQDPQQQMALMEAAYQRGAQTAVQQVSQQEQMPEMQNAVDVAREPASRNAGLLGKASGGASPQGGVLNVNSVQELQNLESSGLPGLPNPYRQASQATGSELQSELGNIAKLGEEKVQALQQGYEQGDYVKKMQDFDTELSTIRTRANQVLANYEKTQTRPPGLFASDSIWSNIGTALSVLAGGVSQGLTGAKSNPVLDYIDRQIQMDVERQKFQSDKLQNQFSMLLQEGHSVMNAANLTAANQKMVVAGKLGILAQKTQNAQVKATMLTSKKELLDQADKAYTTVAFNRMTDSGAVKLSPEVMIERQVPKEERKQAREELALVQSTEATATRARKIFEELREIHTFDQRPSTNAKFNRLQVELKTLIGKGFKEVFGALNEGDAKRLIDPIIPGRTTTSSSIDEYEKTFLDSIYSGVDGKTQLLKTYRIPTQSTRGQDRLEFKGK